MKRELVILDTSTLINFVKVNRVDILKKLANYSFRAPYIVINEVSKGSDKKRLMQAIRNKYIKPESMDLTELKMSERLLIPHRSKPNIGKGEAPVLAIGMNRKWKMAIEERAAIEIIKQKIGEKHIIQTKDFLLEAIKKRIITVEKADSIKLELETHHCFRMKEFASFRDLMNITLVRRR
jgi:predicted nucleic acid-binding protein